MITKYGRSKAVKELTDDEIQTEIDEINYHLGACAKLKPGPWRAEYTKMSHHWHDDPCSHTMHVMASHDVLGDYPIAGGTIYDTQREIYFMAAMRELVPQLLEAQREALQAILAMRKQLARKRKKRAS